MRRRSDVGLIGRLRSCLLRDHVETVARLEREVDALRRASHDSASLRPLVVEVLRQEVQRAPQKMAAILEPLLEEMLERRVAAAAPPSRRPPRRPARWLPAAAAGMLLMAGGGFGVTRRTPPAAVVSDATAIKPVEAAAKLSAPAPVILQKRDDGFGLGQAAVTDAQLAREVRARLASCPELAGAAVSFSVKDGWVWLRGETSASGRDAAEQALSDIGEGTFVVNQLVVGKPAADMLAER